MYQKKEISKGEISMYSGIILPYDQTRDIEITKEFTFDSSHHLLEYDGVCSRVHGHTYKLQVTVEGKVDNIGMLIDFKILKEVVKDKILDVVDHEDLNKLMSYNTTAENMCMSFYDILSGDKRLQNVKVTKIRLWETPTSYATYRPNTTKRN